MTLAVAVHGAAGRMGVQVLQALTHDTKAGIVGAIERNGSPKIGHDVGELVGRTATGMKVTDKLDEGLSGADVVIDFSGPAAAAVLARECAKRKLAAVFGTTGLDARAEEAIAELAAVAPVVVSPNMSVGVTLLFHLASLAVKMLGSEFDIEIVEMHHRLKADSPSGTAKRLAEVVARARGLDPERSEVHGRSGTRGPRSSSEIGVLALRGGDVIGDHTVILAGPGERIELVHRAHDREIFARRAVRAAHWVAGKPPGRYGMAEVLLG